jgi:hypothetical protein
MKGQARGQRQTTSKFFWWPGGFCPLVLHVPIFSLSGTLSYIRVLGVVELIEFNHSGLFSSLGREH